MKRNIMIIAIAVAVAATLPAQGQKQDTHSSNVAPMEIGLNVDGLSLLGKPVERVNGTILTERDLLREMYAIFPYAKQHNGFPKAMEAEIRRGALLMITFEELVYQEALRRKMTIAPERLAKAQTEFRKQFASQLQYQHFLETEVNGSWQVMRTKIKRSLLIEDLLKAEVTDKSTVTLAEVRAFYLSNPERFQVPESYAVQTITIMPPRPANPKQAPVPPTPEQLKQMKARAEAALRQAREAKTYEEFGVLAEKISEDDYRVMMGNHHPLPAAQLPPEVLQAASKLQPGQISGLIQVDGAYTILRLNAHTPTRKQKLQEVSTALRVQMQRQKSDKLRHELDTRLRKNAKIEQLIVSH
ncbi:MAG TPA: peptidylprolyl isomerase [Candidatus Angelobacter sp.]|nr:peptidylprolyl isomerase [Candidatus Angelobacter sp.]